MVVALDRQLEERKADGGGGDGPEASLQEYQLQTQCDGLEEQPLAAPPARLRTCLIHACLASDASLQAEQAAVDGPVVQL